MLATRIYFMHYITKSCFLILTFYLMSCSLLQRQVFDEQDKYLFDHTYAIPKFNRNLILNNVVATYFGTSSILFDDSDDAILIDGFFTRPSLSSVIFHKIKQIDQSVIDDILEDANMSRLRAVIAVHSHHDHALDSPCIAQRYSAVLLGSSSTMKIECRSFGPAPLQLVVDLQDENIISKPIEYGNFTVTMIRSDHSPTGKIGQWLLGIDKSIDRNLTMPARFTEFNEGQSFSILIEHEKTTILVHASSGFESSNLATALQNKKVDWLFLGIGNLANQNNKRYQEKYFEETLGVVKPDFLVPIHWDDFTEFSTETLYPARKIFGNFKKEFKLLEEALSTQTCINCEPTMYLMNFSDQIILDGQ